MSHCPPAPSTPPPAPPRPDLRRDLRTAPDDDVSLVIEEPRFSLVPEWVIDAGIPDSSFRLYCLLLRYGGSSGQRMPSRTTLARRLRRSVDAVDRAMKELVAAGVVRVEHRRDGQRYLSNRYHVRTSSPLPVVAPPGGGRTSAATTPAQEGGRRGAATPVGPGGGRTSAVTPGRTDAATPGRTFAAGVAADLRHDQEVLTESTNPPPPGATSSADRAGREEKGSDRGLLATCGVEDLDEVAARCMAARRALGRSTTRWAGPCVAAALRLAVAGRGWPGELAVPALLAVAADPASQSPMRLAEAGPWWDQVADGAGADEGGYDTERAAADEQRLADLPGGRHVVQATARGELSREGMPLTRATVVRRACEILDREAAR